MTMKSKGPTSDALKSSTPIFCQLSTTLPKSFIELSTTLESYPQFWKSYPQLWVRCFTSYPQFCKSYPQLQLLSFTSYPQLWKSYPQLCLAEHLAQHKLLYKTHAALYLFLQILIYYNIFICKLKQQPVSKQLTQSHQSKQRVTTTQEPQLTDSSSTP